MLNKLIHNKLGAACASILILFSILHHTTYGLSVAGDRDGRKLFGGYKITPKFCTNEKNSKADAMVSGPAICMFNHECVERKGKVIGACMDGFLFGTCCLLSGMVETSLANVKANLTAYQQASAVMEELATRGPMISSSKPQIINNQFYGGSDESSIHVDENVKQDISNEAVVVSSPSYADRISSPSYYPIKSSTSQSSYVTELPNYIQSSSTYFTSDEDSNDHNNLIQFSQVPYDHSDIAHSPADSDVFSSEDDGNIINPYPIPSTNDLMTETRTTDTTTLSPQTTSKFSKPIFKPKPTQSYSPTTEKYVLVHTITNDKPLSNDIISENISTKKPSSTNDSIQSIILMLNGTNSSGPEYNVDSTNVNADNTQTTSSYVASTSMIDYDKYGGSSFYITTKVPERVTSLKVPSTSYVYSPNPTRRPTTSATKKSTVKSKTTTTRSASKVKTSTRQPPTTLNVPSTSYVYSPNPITKRPGASSTVEPVKDEEHDHTTMTDKKKTSPKPILVVSSQQHQQIQQHHQQDDIQSNYVVISGGGITKHPSPTVHITPKPITNLLTSSTVNQLKQTKPPNELTSEQSSTSTVRPPPPFFISTTPATFISSSIYVPAIQDFHNEGYFAVVTHRPSNGVSSTAIYAVSPGLISQPDANKESEIDTPVISNDDLTNFPPVRNPNLNMTATNNLQESDISTPSFVEDSQLNDKIDLLVNKLIESMQGNLDNLVDIVYERKNLTSIDVNKKKNTTLADAAVTKPTRTTIKQSAPTRPPPKTSTAPPGRPSSQQQQTSKKPQQTKTTTTATKKPASSKPASSTATTKRPPNRVTSPATTTRKPTKRVTTVKTTTTQAPIAEDELLEEEELPVEEEGSEGQDETAEEGEESNVVDESEVPAVENGKIQCGVRPHYKKGRIVGGTAAAFGEFPWQVLVRESTWLGLFTKNKCGGVLISNSYVLTAAHCQPGFLASLVAVFGEYDISADLETKRSVTKNVKRVIVHRQYDAATFENDLAILELESPVRYDTHIVPICMPPDGADYTGKVATVSGWGRLKYGGGVPSVLQEVQVPIIENSVCQDMFEHAGHKKKILPSFLCAGYANGQKDSCEGDSGGPLVMQRPDGRYQLIGTVSHGIKCAAPFLPGVYMRTNFYKPWIKSITSVK